MNIPIKKFEKGAFIYLSGGTPPKEFYVIKSRDRLRFRGQILY